ncbi:hypothetical protein GG344DRAFT_83797 [Lentinula edodes]|nr:hypothetical protein GG344DRAFT_83797 [Lentinula edodes]
MRVDPGSKVGSTPAPKHPHPVTSAVESSHVGNSTSEGEGTSDYCRVVLVLRPPPVPDSEVPPRLPEAVRPGPELTVPPSARIPSRSQGSGGLRCQIVPSGSSKQFAPLLRSCTPCNRAKATRCLSADDEWDSSEVINNTAVTPLVPGNRE